jgi:ribonuclease J
VPEDTLVELTAIKSLPKDKVVIACTGSQGENMSALHRMAFSMHKQVEIQPGDRVIISASAIPGNEVSVSNIVNELYRKGADVIYNKKADLHVSGHACQEEQKMMLALTKPKFFIPVHGEYRMLVKHAELGKLMGVLPKNVIVGENGKVIELTKKSIKCEQTVPSGAIMVDGTSVGEVGSVVMRDRHRLAEDGMVVVILPFSSDTKGLISDPEIVTRGFIYVKEAEEMMDELKRVAIESVISCENQNIRDWSSIKNRVKNNISGYLYKTTRRSPMILPVITEV